MDPSIFVKEEEDSEEEEVPSKFARPTSSSSFSQRKPFNPLFRRPSAPSSSSSSFESPTVTGRKKRTPPNVDEPARLSLDLGGAKQGEPMPKYQRTAHVDSGVFDDQALKGIIDRLEIGETDHSYSMLSGVLKSFRPNEAKLFDAFHTFTTIVEGGCGVSTPFWKKDAMKGHQHLAKLAYDALVQPKASWPVSEVPFMPFTVHDLEFALTMHQAQGRSAREAIISTLFNINHNSKNYRVELTDPAESEWMIFKDGPDILALHLWSKLSVRHHKHAFTLAPSRLSVEAWLESIRLDKQRGEIAALLSRTDLNDLEAIETALVSVMDPKFWAAFLNAMNIAKQKIPEVNFLLDRLFSLIFFPKDSYGKNIRLTISINIRGLKLQHKAFLFKY